MADQDTESRLTSLEEQVAKLRGGGSVFRPISPLTARNPLFFRGKTIDNKKLKDRTRSYLCIAGAASVKTGTAALAAQGTNKLYQAWSLANGALNDIVFPFTRPTDYIVGSSIDTVYIYWTNLGAGSGNVVWEMDAYAIQQQTNMNTASALSISTTDTAPTQDKLRRFAIFNAVGNVFGGGTNAILHNIVVRRDGTNLSDTLGNAAGLVAVQILYSADM